ncbi:MAG: citrate lyase holo-[acyl-carrier protein] synthase [Schleiferilactobacillus harbinensis]|nr:citrate lyase holo-[acyl-carrier protein] synthase [Schleiferilactobacillus harbinensis]MCI1911687.1 citrate lyase holo-[acyl-carrier protein] synthase [Schleiferilactobacillus harbinensis]
MAETIFATGAAQDIMAVLANKDARVAWQDKLMAEYPEDTILASKLNIPGPIKNNDQLEHLFATGVAQLAQLFPATALKTETTWHKPTGPEAFWVVDMPVAEAKQIAVQFEDDFALGRLFDVDALTATTQERPLSRQDLGFAARRCLICGRPAKDCARSRRHSVAELQANISQRYFDYFKDGGHGTN